MSKPHYHHRPHWRADPVTKRRTLRRNRLINFLLIAGIGLSLHVHGGEQPDWLFLALGVVGIKFPSV